MPFQALQVGLVSYGVTQTDPITGLAKTQVHLLETSSCWMPALWMCGDSLQQRESGMGCRTNRGCANTAPGFTNRVGGRLLHAPLSPNLFRPLQCNWKPKILTDVATMRDW